MKYEKKITGKMLWRMVVVAGLLCCAIPVCAWQSSSNCLEGNGETGEQHRVLSGYDQITVEGAYTIHIVSNAEFKFRLRGDSNLLSHVMTKVENGKLRIYSSQSMCMKQPLELEIGTQHLKQFNAEGAHEITISGLAEDKFVMVLDGASLAITSGKVRQFILQMSGTSTLDAQQLLAHDVTVEAGGTTASRLNVDGTLSVEASGIAEVVYSGNPTSVKSDLSGLAEVAPN